MCADDTSLFILHTKITKLYENVNIDFSTISKWFKIQKLSINIKNKHINIANVQIKIDQIVR